MLRYQLCLLVCAAALYCALALPVQDGFDQEEPFQLTVNPKLVNRYTTKNMTLRCDHNPGVQTNMDEIFRMRIMKKSDAGWDFVAEQRDVVQTPSVTGHVRATANIRGDMSTVFLQVSWDTVGNDSFGVFRCDVTGFDAKANIVTESSSEVEIQEFQNFIGHFESLSKEAAEKVRELQNWTETEIFHLKQDFNGLKKSVAEIQTNEPSFENRLVKLETFLGGLTQWPGGFYALLQPKTGCPVDLAFFGGTHRFHKIHSESQPSLDPDDNQSTAFSILTSIRVNSKKFVVLEFCEVTRQFNTASWPRGSFCVHKIFHQSCPAGFTSGRVAIDTENTDFSGDARNNIADRVYDPYLYFCCQNRSSAEVPIQLPTDSPFLLYRYGGVCQKVQGMSVSEEFIQINTDDTGLVDYLYHNPDLDRPGSSGIKFHLCFYTKL